MHRDEKKDALCCVVLFRVSLFTFTPETKPWQPMWLTPIVHFLFPHVQPQ